MPGPNVLNRKTEEKKASQNERQAYFLTDPDCREINGLEVTDDMRDKGLMLTSGEAMALIAAGALTTSKDDADKAREAHTASVDALRQRQADEAEAQRLKDEAKGEAVAHNTGQSTAAVEEKPGIDRPLTSAEVDRQMQADPAASPNVEGNKTWAQTGV